MLPGTMRFLSFYRNKLCFLAAGAEKGTDPFTPKLHRKIDYMLIAGLIGLVYSVVEKAVLGNIFSIVVGLAIPMHIVWQLNQGGHYFEYEQHKAAGRPREAKKEWLMAILLPFLFHGCWDSALSIASYCVNREEIPPQVFGGLLFLARVDS